MLPICYTEEKLEEKGIGKNREMYVYETASSITLPFHCGVPGTAASVERER